jgi:hypothetical protein
MRPNASLCWRLLSGEEDARMANTIFPPTLTGLVAKGLESGRIEMLLVDKGTVIGGIEVAANLVGNAAATILGAALAAFKHLGKPGLPAPASPLPVLQASKIWIEPHPMPNRCTLHVQCGEAHIGFEVSHEKGRELAQGLLDASAKPDVIQ